jgi:hypothetical protein
LRAQCSQVSLIDRFSSGVSPASFAISSARISSKLQRSASGRASFNFMSKEISEAAFQFGARVIFRVRLRRGFSRLCSCVVVHDPLLHRLGGAYDGQQRLGLAFSLDRLARLQRALSAVETTNHHGLEAHRRDRWKMRVDPGAALQNRPPLKIEPAGDLGRIVTLAPEIMDHDPVLPAGPAAPRLAVCLDHA